MKIALLSRTQNTTQRGVETFVKELSVRLSKNHQVEILTGRNSDSFMKMISGHYDIVMPFNGRGQSLKASIGRIFGGYKLIIGGHSGIGRDDIWNICIAQPDVFIALTDYMSLWAKKWNFRSKVVKINNGVDLNKFKQNGPKIDLGLKPPVVLSVGALVWYKYHERAIEAVAKLKDVSLLIVGAGEKQAELENLGKEKLGDRFKIMKINYQDMPKVYRSADLFTLPSWDRESFGLVYLEAMASGLPCVGPDDKPRREIIGEGGILVDVSNQDKYAEALSKALGKKWDGLPKKQAEKFSWEKITREYEKCFQDLLK